MNRFTEIGKFNEFIYLLGNPYMPVYMVRGKNRIALIDSGVTFIGVIVYQQLMELGIKFPDLIFLTHSHYDHLGGTPFLKKKFPGMKIFSHPLVESILEKEKAVKLIEKLNLNDEKLFGADKFFKEIDFSFKPFKIDFKVHDGEKFDLGNITIEVIYTPGHTRDSVSYYIPEIKAIFFGEAGGVPDMSGRIQPEFTSSFELYLESLERMKQLEIDVIGLAHGGIIWGYDAKNYIKNSIEATKRCRNRIVSYFNETGSIEKVVERIFKEDYNPSIISQPEIPYRINLEAKVKKVIEEFKYGKS